MKPENRLTNEEIKARLILVVGIGLTLSFVMAIASLIFGLLFVVQPTEQSPNDAEAWGVLSPIHKRGGRWWESEKGEQLPPPRPRAKFGRRRSSSLKLWGLRQGAPDLF